jgi:Phosphodiester glycosidase
MRSHTPPRSPLVALAILVLVGLGTAGVAHADIRDVVPGISYERLELPGQVHHVMRVRQGPLIEIKPVLTAGVPSRRARLTDAMRGRLGEGAVIGVNGDYFNLDNAYPSGLLMTGGEVVSEPEATRSALIFGGGGQLSSAQVQLTGTWQASDPALPTPLPERTFIGVNRPAERANETVVYTPRYGDLTAPGDRVDAIITMDDPAGPAANRPLTGVVHSIHPGGGTGIGPGKLVISGTGTAGNAVLSDLIPGRRVTMSFTMAGLPADTVAALGGGPALVQGGIPLNSVSEGFSNGQIGTRTSRTAIGQTADGTVLLVTSEGTFQGSRGVSMVEQAQLMASLGAQTAVGMDGGGSAAMSLRDNLLIPWESERAITDALVVNYRGVQLTEPAPFLSPNGDGVDDRSATTVRSAIEGTVRVSLARPNGKTVKNLYKGPLGPSGVGLSLDAGSLGSRDGQYRIIARFTAGDGSGRTDHSHGVTIDRTLGFLRVAKVGAAPNTRVRVGFRITKTAPVTAVIRDANGGAVKVLFRNRRLAPGNWAALWDMTRKGKRVKPGVYTIVVAARSSVGDASLTARAKVAKIKKPKPPVEPPPAVSTRPFRR